MAKNKTAKKVKVKDYEKNNKYDIEAGKDIDVSSTPSITKETDNDNNLKSCN